MDPVHVRHLSYVAIEIDIFHIAKKVGSQGYQIVVANIRQMEVNDTSLDVHCLKNFPFVHCTEKSAIQARQF